MLLAVSKVGKSGLAGGIGGHEMTIINVAAQIIPDLIELF
jgi:hypothetical protein